MVRLKSFCSLMVMGLAIALPSTAAHAAVVLSFEAGAATPVGPGSVSVPIYLHEMLDGGSSSVIAPDGLFSIGVAITRTSGDATITSFVRNPTFDQINPGTSTTATLAKINAEQNANFGNGPNPDGNGLILFATATIQQGAALSGFSIGDFGPGDQTIDYGFEAHDGQILAGSFDVQAVPEPASLGLLAIAGMLLVRRRANT